MCCYRCGGVERIYRDLFTLYSRPVAHTEFICACVLPRGRSQASAKLIYEARGLTYIGFLVYCKRNPNIIVASERSIGIVHKKLTRLYPANESWLFNEGFTTVYDRTIRFMAPEQRMWARFLRRTVLGHYTLSLYFCYEQLLMYSSFLIHICVL